MNGWLLLLGLLGGHLAAGAAELPARARFLVTAPTEPVDLLVAGERLAAVLGFGSLTVYHSLPAGRVELALASQGADQPVVVEVGLAAGWQTVLLQPFESGWRAVALRDERRRPIPAGQAVVRLVHAGATGPRVVARVGRGESEEPIDLPPCEPSAATADTAVSAGAGPLTVKALDDSGQPDEVVAGAPALSLDAGWAYTIYLLGPLPRLHSARDNWLVEVRRESPALLSGDGSGPPPAAGD